MRGHGYDTHTWLYTFRISAAYFQGYVPGIVILFPLWMILVIIIYKGRELRIDSVGNQIRPSTSKLVLMVGPLFVLNTAVTVTTAFFYVESQSSGLGTSTKLVFQLMFAVFDISWDQAAIPGMLRYLQVSPKVQFYGRLFIKVFNVLISSSLSTMLADPMCYSELLLKQNTISSTYYIELCLSSTYSNLVVTCDEYGELGPFVT